MADIKPNTPYQWADQEQFSLNGKEFEFFINTVRAILSTQEAQKYLLISELGKVLEAKLAEGIQDGRVKEAPPKEEKEEAPE
jgi:hypothetical protein